MKLSRKVVVATFAMVAAMVPTLATPVSAATTIHVSASASGANDGSSWADAYVDLQDALAVAGAGDEVRIAGGTYEPHASDRTVSFTPSEGVTLTGGYSTGGSFNPDFYETILSGDLLGNDNDVIDHAEATRSDNTYTVLTTSEPDITLRHLTITGGNANGTGLVTGGGIRLDSGSDDARIDHLLVTANSATTNSGGLYINARDAIVTNSTITNNDSGNQNGGIKAGGGAIIINTSITNNTASRGGAGRAEGTYVNVLIADNTASYGGGFYDSTGAPTTSSFINSTIANNTATSNGGALGSASGGTPHTATFINSVIWGNTAPTDPTFNSDLPDPIITNTNIQGGFAGTNNTSTDPLFVDPVGGDYRLTHLSPAENAADDALLPVDTYDLDDDGDTTEPIPTDLVGADRSQLGGVDLGALETAPPDPRGFIVLDEPCPLFDSRTSTGARAGIFTGGELRTISAAGSIPGDQGVPAGSCIPNGVSAATVTITAIDPAESGNLRLSPAGVVPNGGVVNYAANDLFNSNTVTTELSLFGDIDIFANAPLTFGLDSTHVRVSVIGYYPETGGDNFVALTPCAVLDSRSTQSSAGTFVGPFAPGDALPEVDVVGTFPAAQGGGNTDCGVPSGATAIVANLVAVAATGGRGGLEAGTGGTSPSERLVSFAPIGVNNAAQIIVPLDGGETVSIDVVGQAAASVEVRMVVVGYYIGNGGSQFVPLTACAAFDTRDTQGSSGAFTGKRLGGDTTTYQIAGDIPAAQGGGNGGDCGVPVGASAVLINNVAIAPDVGGNFQAYATGTSPTGGILNFGPTTPAANNSNAIPIPMSGSGAIDLFTNTGSSVAPATHARGVVLGYYE